jgi:hypothetical protein
VESIDVAKAGKQSKAELKIGYSERLKTTRARIVIPGWVGRSRMAAVFETAFRVA